MSSYENEQGGVVGAHDDPQSFQGPGVTPQPDNADQVFNLASVVEENARLRAQLLDENERLRSALADAQAAGLSTQGLSDEDVRRLEHPEEFAAVAENEALQSRLNHLERQLAQIQATGAGLAQPQAQPQPGASRVTGPGQVGQSGLTGPDPRTSGQHPNTTAGG